MKRVSGSASSPVERPVSRLSRGSWLALWHPGRVEWNRLTAGIEGLHPALAGLRIVHLTDLHLRGDWCSAYDRLIERINEAEPDLLLFTGDFIDSKDDHRAAIPTLERMFGQFKTRLGIFGVLGNHDGYLVGPLLKEMGVTWLNHQRMVLGTPEAEIELIGLPLVYFL